MAVLGVSETLEQTNIAIVVMVYKWGNMKLNKTPEISNSSESTATKSFSAFFSNDLLTDIVRTNLSEIYIFDARTLHFLFVNDGALKNLGYTLAQMQHLTPVHLKPEFTEETFRARIQPLVDHQLPTLNFETIHRRCDGSRYPVEVKLQYYRTYARRI